MTKYTLYRGAPYSGLSLEKLEGRGGYGQQMLGSGLYCTDDYYVAEGYVHEDPYSRHTSSPCVYTLELNIPDDEIYFLDAHDYRKMSHSQFGSAIPHIFGVKSPAFEMTIRDRETGEDFVYLISEEIDPMKYSLDFTDHPDSLGCLNEILDEHSLGVANEYISVEDYIANAKHELFGDTDVAEAFADFARDETGGDEHVAIEKLQSLVDERVKEASGLPHYGLYGKQPRVLHGGDSTDLTDIVGRHGYKVLWASAWIASGDEVVIIDESIYNNGLTIVDDCTRTNPALERVGSFLVNPIRGDDIWFHGSWIGRIPKFKWKSPRSEYYGATYISSDQTLADDFSKGEKAWFGFDEDPPRAKRTGYTHRVKIKAVKLLDPDNLFSDMESLTLTDEGVQLVDALKSRGLSDGDIRTIFRGLARFAYNTFTKMGNRMWEPLSAALEDLGYRGWFEREGVVNDSLNIALFYPDEDAVIVGGYTVRRTVKGL
jgi:hypothetical protein